MAASIFLKSIAKKINNEIVIADLDLGLQKGDRLTIIGANNSGKTILLKIIAGIIDIDSGEVFIDGKKLDSSQYSLRESICYIPEYIDFDDDLNIYENLYFYLRLNMSISNNDIKGLISQWSKTFKFEKMLDYKVNKVSKSKLRLIQLCRAFMHSPDFLILDHPTKGLDPENKTWFWETLNSVLKDSTVVCSSQDFDEIENYSNRLAFLSQGNIKLKGTISDIIGKTKEYGYYAITFNTKINSDIVKKMQENSNLYHLKIEENKVEFYTPQKNVFFDALRQCLEYDILDIEVNSFKLKDVFLTQVKKI